MKLACSSMLAVGSSIGEQLAYLARFGFEGVELRLAAKEATPERVAEIEGALASTTLGVACLLVPSPAFEVSLSSEDARRAKLADARVAMDLGARLGGPVLLLPEVRPQPQLPHWRAPLSMTPAERELLLSFAVEVAEYAERVSAVAMLEPINRYVTHFLHRLEQAVEICQRVGSPRVKVVADFFHMNIEEVDIAESIHRSAGYLHHVQLGDSNRRLPGQGHLDFRPGFAALRRIGYDRYLSLECSVHGEPEVELPKCVQFVRRLIEEAQTS